MPAYEEPPGTGGFLFFAYNRPAFFLPGPTCEGVAIPLRNEVYL